MIFTCIDRLHHPMNHRKYTILSHYYIILSYIENPVTIVIISGFSPESSRPALEAASATPPKEIHLAGASDLRPWEPRGEQQKMAARSEDLNATRMVDWMDFNGIFDDRTCLCNNLIKDLTLHSIDYQQIGSWTLLPCIL